LKKEIEVAQTKNKGTQSDIERIYDVCDSLYGSYHGSIDRLANKIAKDFHAGLAKAGISVHERDANSGRYRNTREYVLALSRLLDTTGDNFSILLSMACLMQEPDFLIEKGH